jgi:hypothetical protein
MDDIPYNIPMIDIIKYNLCPACRPDEFEDYNIIHTPEYQNRSINNCLCGRYANHTSISHGCTHCTCMDLFSKMVYFSIEKYKIKQKLENDRNLDILHLIKLRNIL